MNENKIVYGNRVKIYFKPGSTTEDFKEILPSKMAIDSNKTLKSKRNLELTANLLKFNDRKLRIYDLDNRVINYVVAKEEDSLLMEDSTSTTWVVKDSDADSSSSLKTLLDESKYVEWESYPVGEYYSYRHTISKYSSSNEIPTRVSEHNNPINFKTYTKWRLEYSTVLLGFYEEIKKVLPNFSIYMDGKPIVSMDKLSSKKVDINLQGFGNLERLTLRILIF
jgi:hypothetical protein